MVIPIPVARPMLPAPQVIARYLEISHERRHYSNGGPLLHLYQKRISKFLGVDEGQVVILCNATQCLQGLVTILDRKTWVVPDFTFAATAEAVLSAGKSLELSDVDETTMALLPSDLSSAALSASRGVIAVMPFGTKCSPKDWGNPNGIIFDAAASLGNLENSLDSLSEESAVVFSLHATKVLGAGEGGIAVCGSNDLANALRSWSQFGFDGGRKSTALGTNAKISEFNVAVALASLDQKEIEIERWATLRKLTNDITLKNFSLNVTQEVVGATPYWILRTDSDEQTTALEKFLLSRSVETRRWWPMPLSKMPFFEDNATSGKNPNSEQLANRLIGLPFFREMSEYQLDFLAESLDQFSNGK